MGFPDKDTSEAAIKGVACLIILFAYPNNLPVFLGAVAMLTYVGYRFVRARRAVMRGQSPD
jgi:hypothetical protein